MITRKASTTALILALIAGTTHADTITFNSGEQDLTALGFAIGEGNFAYRSIAGTLVQTSEQSNPFDPANQVIVGSASTNGGTLEVVAASVTDPPFLFNSIDIAQTGFGETDVVVTGRLNGVTVGSDTFTTSTNSAEYTTVTANTLSGIQLDTLWVQLDAQTGFGGGPIPIRINRLEYVDNLVVTSVPEPTSLALLIPGLALIARRKRH